MSPIAMIARMVGRYRTRLSLTSYADGNFTIVDGRGVEVQFERFVSIEIDLPKIARGALLSLFGYTVIPARLIPIASHLKRQNIS